MAEDLLVNRTWGKCGVYRGYTEPRQLDVGFASPVTSQKMGLSEIHQGYGVACDPAGINENGEWVASITASGT